MIVYMMIALAYCHKFSSSPLLSPHLWMLCSLGGGIIDPWIHKGPIIVVFQSLYSYPVMQRQQTISKASYMDCLAAQPSAFGSPCCRQEDAY